MEVERPTIEFYISFARVPIKVTCFFDTTKKHCQDYLIDKRETAFDVVISKTEFPLLQKLVVETAEKEGREPDEFDEPSLEILALHKAVSDRLPEYGKVLFHCSSIQMDGEAVCFTAPSGTGKSTHSKLWIKQFGDRASYINDDKPFLGYEEGKATVFGSPWMGKHRLGANVDVPLRAIGMIVRDERNYTEQISPVEAFPILLRQIHKPGNKEMLTKTIDIIKKIVEEIPVYNIHCNMDPIAAKISHDGLFGSFERWRG